MLRSRQRFSSFLLTLAVTTSARVDRAAAQDNPGKVPILSPASMTPVMIESGPPARPTRNLWLEDRMVLEGQLTLNGPFGFYAVAVDYSINEWLVINAGIGAGRGAKQSSFGERLQFAVTPRLRLPLSDPLDPLQLAVGVEAGLSEGSFRPSLPCLGGDEFCNHSAWSHVLWLNTHAAFELRYWSLQLRAFAGLGSPLVSKGTTNCTISSFGSSCQDAPSGGPGEALHFGASLGVALF